MTEATDKELIDWAIQNKRVDILVKHKWGFELSDSQTSLVRKIAFLEHKRISISAMTRWGKTQCVAFGIALLIDFNVAAKIAFLGPKQEQAGILRQYMADLILGDKSLMSKAQIYASGEERIGKEASRKRMTFNTGAEYRVFSGEGDAGRLMGFGCVPPDAEILTSQGIMTAEQLWNTKDKLLVYSYNHNKKICEFQRIIYKVKNSSRQLIKIIHEEGSLIVTDNHPVYVIGKGYIEAKDICVKDKLFKCNCLSNVYGRNNMLSMRKHNKKTIESYKQSEKSFLQSQMQRGVAKGEKQSCMGRRSKSSYMSRMWKRIFYKQEFKEEKNLLQFQMQRQSKEEKTEEKNNFNLSILWKQIRNYSCTKRLPLLFKSLCKSSSCGKNGIGQESCMEMWNRKSTMGTRIQQKIKDINQRKRWSQVFFMWKNWLSSNSSYRLQQEQQQRRKSNNIMCELSLQDQLQERDVGEVIVRRVTKKPKGEVTYNFEIENNHNYFVNGILTHNCDILVRDEACLLNRDAFTKSSRMVGDNPEESIIIELYNPWDRDNPAFEHTMDPEWDVTQIGWEQAVTEGRTTQKFIDQQKKDLRPLEFTVLYESKFPMQGEDSLFSLEWIKMSEENHFKLQDQLDNTLKGFRHLKETMTQLSANEYTKKKNEFEEELSKYTKIVACDPAEKGLDETVVVWGIEYNNRFELVSHWSEAKSEPMGVVGKVVDIATKFIEPEIRGKINIDRIGIGSGPLSRLKEVIRDKNIKNIKVLGCHYGEKAMKSDIFHNKKSENYFRLSDLMRDDMMDIPVHHKFRNQLVAEKWERSSSNKKIVKDPDKSPDWGDSLVYFVWKDKSGLAFGFA